MSHYFEYIPNSKDLKAIDCFWHSRPEAVTQVCPHLVTPDNRVDIIFPLGGPPFFSGPMSTYLNASSREIFAIRFRPEFLYHYFKIPLSEFTDKAIDPRLFLDSAQELLQLKGQTQDFASFIQVFKTYFAKHSDQFRVDSRVALVIEALGKGTSLKEIKSKTGISDQHLRRLFDREVGISPKRFEKIERFKRLKLLSHNKKINFSETAIELGYFDQSHLINDCKELSGQSPLSLFS